MKSYIKYHPRREKWFKEDHSLGLANRYHGWIQASHPCAETILDLGAGKGELVRLLRNDGKRAYGIDLRGEDLNGDGLVIADARVLPFKDLSFDAVVDSMFLHDLGDFQEVPEETYNTVIMEIKRVLKPGGGFLTSSHGPRMDSHFRNKVFGQASWGEYRK